MRRVCWDSNLVQQIFTTEADTRLTSESFFRLHRPFDRIRVVATKPYTFKAGTLTTEGEDRFISEQGLLEAFCASDLCMPNRIFVLTGEPGSGKSHLARWLCHMLAGATDRHPIHIPRRVNTLVGVLKQLSQETGSTFDQEPSAYLLEGPVMKVVRYLVSYLDMAVGPGTPGATRSPMLSRLVVRPEMEALLSEQVARYQAARRVGGGDGSELVMIPEEEFGRLAPGGTLAERSEAYATMRGLLSDALRKLTNLDRFDLKHEMEQISQSFVSRGKRPILLLEDITSFDLLHDDLLTFLLDEAAGHFDALVCWTTGYEKAYLRTYQLDRYAARLSLSDSNMEVYALQNGGFRQMVKAYLDAVKPWCQKGMCELYDKCVPAFQGLYPLNPQALERIYENLIGTDQQCRKTPRNLLDRAVKSYLELAEGHGPFPPLKQPPWVKDILYPDNLFRHRDSHPSFVALAAWYGREDKDHLVLNPEVPRLLGTAVPEAFRACGEVVIPLKEVKVEPNELEQGSSVDILSTSQPAPTPTSTEIAVHRLAGDNRLKELRLEIQAWTTTLKTPPHGLELVRGVVKLMSLFKLRVPVPLGHPQGVLAGLTYGKLLAESNLTLEGTRNKLTPTLQFLLLTADPGAANRDDEIWQAALELQVRNSLPEDADIAFLSDWCNHRHSAYRQEACDRIELALGMPLTEWTVAARWMVVAARTGRVNPSYCDLVSHVPGETLPVDLMPFGLASCELDEIDRHIGVLFDGVFSVAKGFYDAPAIMAAMKKVAPEAFLPVFACTAHTKVDSDYRIGGTTPFVDVVREVKHTATVLLSHDLNGSDQEISAELQDVLTGITGNLQGLSSQMDELRRLIGLTERYDLYDAEVGQAWDQGRGRITEAVSLEKVVKEALRICPETIWECLSLANVAGRLRRNSGARAAWAAARSGILAADKLGIRQQADLGATLAGVLESLRQGVQTPAVSVSQAIEVLESAADRTGRSNAVRPALNTIRNELLAGD